MAQSYKNTQFIESVNLYLFLRNKYNDGLLSQNEWVCEQYNMWHVGDFIGLLNLMRFWSIKLNHVYNFNYIYVLTIQQYYYIQLTLIVKPHVVFLSSFHDARPYCPSPNPKTSVFFSFLFLDEEPAAHNGCVDIIWDHGHCSF